MGVQVLVSTILVLGMMPALAFFEGGLLRYSSNTRHPSLCHDGDDDGDGDGDARVQ